MKLDVRDREGKKVKSIEVDEQVFGVKPHRSLVHQALLAHRANRHRGTHKTKSRGEVRGSTIKIRRQKGTGGARQGSIRSPLRRGGGVAFGPRPRSYRQDLPKRMAFRLGSGCLRRVSGWVEESDSFFCLHRGPL